MKTILVNGRFLAKKITGVQRFACEMLAALSKNNGGFYRFVLVTPRLTKKESYPFEIHEDTSVLTGHLWEQFRLPKLVKKLGGDLLWSPCNSGPLSVSNQIVTIHDAAVFAGPEWFSREFGLLFRWMLRKLGKNTKWILTDSLFSQTELIKYHVGSSEKITVIPGGVSFGQTPVARKRLFTQPFVLSVGSRDPRKNIPRLLAAWQKLPEQIKREHLLVLAGGTEKSFRKEELPPSDDKVKWLGYVPDDTLVQLYLQCKLFIFPSLYEGFGLPPLEAMKFGAPVIVSEIPALKELCGDAALYCDPYNIEDIAHKIAQGITDVNLRGHLRSKSEARVALFEWSRSAEKFLALLNTII